MNYGTRTPEEWRAAVAELVLEAELGAYWFDGDSSVWRTAEEFPNAAYPMWRFRDGTEINAALFRPDISADDERRILEIVVGTWTAEQVEQFIRELAGLVSNRKPGQTWPWRMHRYHWWLLVEPGDYASAALAVVESDAAVKAAKENQ